MMKKRGITIIENLVTIVLLAIIVMGTIGGFFISKMGTVRAKHRTVAMGYIREFIEKEIQSGFGGGVYVTVTPEVRVDATDNISYTIQSDPIVIGTEGATAWPYKIVSFNVIWSEPVFGGASSVQCSEKAATYIARHS